MKKRNLGAVAALGFLTFGIYIIYWLYATRKELIAQNKRPDSIPPVILLFLGVFGLVGIVILEVLVGATTQEGDPIRVLAIILGVVVGIASFAAMFILPLWWGWRYCEVAAEVTDGTDKNLLYTIGVIVYLSGLPPVWMLVVQDNINKFVDRQAQAAAPPPPPLPATPTAWHAPEAVSPPSSLASEPAQSPPPHWPSEPPVQPAPAVLPPDLSQWSPHAPEPEQAPEQAQGPAPTSPPHRGPHGPAKHAHDYHHARHVHQPASHSKHHTTPHPDTVPPPDDIAG